MNSSMGRQRSGLRLHAALFALAAWPASASDLPDLRGAFADSVASVVTGSGDDAGDEVKQQVGGSILDWFEEEIAQGEGDKRSKPARSKSKLPEVQAGLAFEIHVADAGGKERPVDPTNHVFRTGDRFRVYFRPSLPGRVVVVNVNPLGVAKEIDNARVPAGELVTLGPYEFVADKGIERLRLSLQPCGDSELLKATRDIVKLEAQAASPPVLTMLSCDELEPIPPGNGTRDIRKVQVQGNTGYALDPVADAEMRSGALAPRSVEIALQHR